MRGLFPTCAACGPQEHHPDQRDNCPMKKNFPTSSAEEFLLENQDQGDTGMSDESQAENGLRASRSRAILRKAQCPAPKSEPSFPVQWSSQRHAAQPVSSALSFSGICCIGAGRSCSSAVGLLSAQMANLRGTRWTPHLPLVKQISSAECCEGSKERGRGREGMDSLSL